MSPSEIGRIQPVTPGRNIRQDHAATAAKSSASLPSESKSENAVKVETSEAANSGQPPIDRSRVEIIRKALENGTYPLSPTKIADAMIAAPLLLSIEQ